MVEDARSQGTDSLIRPAATDRWPRGIAYEGGFRILGTPISFGRTHGATLRFISNVDEPLPRLGDRILVTPAAAAAMGAERHGFDALALGFDRKIRLGRMDIQLHSAGLGLGSAQFEVAFKDRRIVFCGGVRLTQPLACQPVVLPRCDLLLLDVEPAEPRPPSPRRVAPKIRAFVEEACASSRLAVLVCGSLSAALDVCSILQDLDAPMRAVRPLYEMACRVGPFGIALPGLCRLEQALPDHGVVVHLERLWLGARAAQQRDDLAVARVGPGRDEPAWAEACFRLGEGEDRPGLVEYAAGTGASQIAMGPRCDEETFALLEKAGLNPYRVSRPEQIPLPFR